MTLDELDSFLQKVGAPSLEAYLGVPDAEDAPTALDDKMKWAAWHFRDPDRGEEAEFVMAHALQLRAILDEGEPVWRDRQSQEEFSDKGGRWLTMPSFLTPGGAPGRALGDGRTIIPPDGGVKPEATSEPEAPGGAAPEPAQGEADETASDTTDEGAPLGGGRTLVPSGSTPVTPRRDLQAPTLPSFDDFDGMTVAPMDLEPVDDTEPEATPPPDQTLPTFGDAAEISGTDHADDSTDPVGFTASELEPSARKEHPYTPSGRTRRTHSDRTYDLPPDPAVATGSHTWVDWDEVGERPTDPSGEAVDLAEAPTVKLATTAPRPPSSMPSLIAMGIGILILLLGALVLVVVALDVGLRREPIEPPAPQLPLAIPAPLPEPEPRLDSGEPGEPLETPEPEAPQAAPEPVPDAVPIRTVPLPEPPPRRAVPTPSPAPAPVAAAPRPPSHPLIGTWRGGTGAGPMALRIQKAEGGSFEATVEATVDGVPQTLDMTGTWDPESSAIAFGSSGGPSFLGKLDDKGLRGTWSETPQGARKQWFVVRQ